MTKILQDETRLSDAEISRQVEEAMAQKGVRKSRKSPRPKEEVALERAARARLMKSPQAGVEKFAPGEITDEAVRAEMAALRKEGYQVPVRAKHYTEDGKRMTVRETSLKSIARGRARVQVYGSAVVAAGTIVKGTPEYAQYDRLTQEILADLERNPELAKKPKSPRKASAGRRRSPQGQRAAGAARAPLSPRKR